MVLLVAIRQSSAITPYWLFALFALTLLAYANSFQTGFPLDNRFLILEDPVWPLAPPPT